jgi:dienelactone hydrolase
MRRFIFTSVVLALVSGSASAAMVERRIGYEVGGKAFEGVLVYDDSVKTKRPAILMEPDWWGVAPNAIAQAKEIAGKDYVIFVADIFGASYAPKNRADKVAAVSAIRRDVKMARALGGKGLEVMLAEGEKLGIIDPAKVAGIGFCFGGGVLLDVAREGHKFNALAVFHVTLPQSADPTGPSNIKGAVLVLHGANDPITPRKAISALEDELDVAKVRWQTVLFSGAVHSFTDVAAPEPEATTESQKYDPELAKRSYGLMREFFAGNL